MYRLGKRSKLFSLACSYVVKCGQLKFKKEFFSPSNAHPFPPGKEAGVNIRFGFNIYTSANVYGYYGKL